MRAASQAARSSLELNRSGEISPDQMQALTRMSRWRIFSGITLLLFGAAVLFPLLWALLSPTIEQPLGYALLIFLAVGMLAVTTWGIFILLSTHRLRASLRDVQVEYTRGIPKKHDLTDYSTPEVALAAKAFPDLRNRTGLIILNGITYGVLNAQLPEQQNLHLFRSIQDGTEGTFYFISAPLLKNTSRIIINYEVGATK